MDIGAGTGNFCEIQNKILGKSMGLSPVKKREKLLPKKIFFYSKALQDFKGQQFDVVTLWHVLEHLPDLENTITAIQKLLKPNGVLIVAVPNYNSFDAKHYKRFWAAYDVPRHLWHFSQKSMRQAVFRKHEAA